MMYNHIESDSPCPYCDNHSSSHIIRPST